jgi:hypothetical protein
MNAIINPFDAGGYSLAEMTQAINILPNLYTRLGQMGLFRFEGVTQRSVIIEQAEGVLNLLPTVPLGGPATVANRDSRSMRSFTVPWIPHDDAITPQDIQGVRGFGVADAADPLATVMERKLTRMRAKHAQTREFMEVNALKGIVRDGAGSTLYDYFAEFGLDRQQVDFTLGTAATNVQAKVREVLRKVETELKGETMTSVLALVSPEYFDKLISHAKVEAAYQYYASTGAQPLREDVRRRFLHRVRGIQRHRDALHRRHRDPDPGRRGHRLPAGHHGHLRHLWRPGQPDRDGQHPGRAHVRPPARPHGRQRHRRQDRGVHPAGEQAPASGGPSLLRQLTMTAFDAAIDDLFADANLAVTVLYEPAGGEARPVRALVRRPDRDIEFSDITVQTSTAVFEIRRHDVPAPLAGDIIVHDGDSFVVQGEPRLDDERLIWTLDTRPA